MMNKIKAIIKRPDEKVGHMTWISDTLRNIQNTVEGYIETVELAPGVICICNEEGKVRNLEPNFFIRTPYFGDIICGTVAIVGIDGEDFADVPISMTQWKAMLRLWDNDID